MADNNIPIPPNAGQAPEYDGDAEYRAYLNAVAPSVDKICTDYSWSTLDGLWMDFRWTIDGRL